MKEFTPILTKIENKLDIPQPARARVILEIRTDLDDTFNYYIEEGFTKHEAISKTKEQFDPTDETMAELSELHQSLYNRLIDKVSGHFKNRFEKAGLVFLLVFIIIASGRVLTSNPFFLNSSIFTLPVLSIGLVAVILSIRKVFTLFIKMDHNISRLRKGLPVILFLGGASLLAGVIGLFIETYLFFGAAAFNIDNFLVLFIGYLVRISSMMMISLLVTMLVALIWFLLANKIVYIERVEAESMLFHTNLS